MLTEVVTRVLAQPFFAGLPHALVRELCAYGTPAAFPAGRRVFGEGEPAERFWLLESGTVAPHRLIHTIHSVGAVTAALTAGRPGSVLGVRGPYGRSWDVASAAGRDVVVVAGGIGLAPLRPVVQAVLADRDRYGRMAVLVGARTPADLLYPDDLRRWERQAKVAVTVDRPGVAGAQHAVRGRLVWALPARPGVDLPGRAGLRLCPGGTVAHRARVVMDGGSSALPRRGIGPCRSSARVARMVSGRCRGCCS